MTAGYFLAKRATSSWDRHPAAGTAGSQLLPLATLGIRGLVLLIMHAVELKQWDGDRADLAELNQLYPGLNKGGHGSSYR